MCKELYDRGTLSEYRDLEETTAHLIDLRRSLSLAPSHRSAQGPPQQNDDLLMKIATQCSETAELLVKKLQGFSIAGGPNDKKKKRQVFSKTVKGIWKGDDVQKLQRQLDAYQKALDTQILVDLR